MPTSFFSPVTGFEIPKAGQYLWKYMDFTKFVAMLASKKLYFPRVDLLGDSFEGHLPDELVGMDIESGTMATGESMSQEDLQRYRASGLENARRFTYVSCWHQNQHESEAMWRLYSQSAESIAIRTTIDRADAAFTLSGQRIFAGMVRYYDTTKGNMTLQNDWHTFFWKRMSYSHEREFRLVVRDDDGIIIWSSGSEYESAPGMMLDAELGELVEAVFVSPTSPEWFRNLVVRVSRDYGLTEVTFQTSELSRRPLY